MTLRIPRLSLLLALAMPTSAAAQEVPAINPPPAGGAVERRTGPSAEDVAAYEAVLGRFKARSDEFTQDARVIVDQLEEQERQKIGQTYDVLITDLADQELELRTDAIRRFEAFLAKYPRTEYSAHIMYRLADLYFDVAEDEFNLAMAEYEQLTNDLPPERLAELPPPPSIDLSPSITLFQRIIADYPDYEFLDGTHYALGHAYKTYAEGGALDREPEAEELYRQNLEILVSRFPQSPFATEGNYLLGEYFFNNNEVDLAIPYFQVVVNGERSHPLFDEGQYMLAWSYYRLSEYDEALRLFTALLDYSDEQLLQSGRASETRKEGIEYSAITFSDIADRSIAFANPRWQQGATEDVLAASEVLTQLGLGPRRVTPVEVSEAWFRTVGERSYEIEITKRLARTLYDQARYDESIAAYNYLQKRWPDDPENPDFLMEVARIYSRLGEVEAASMAQAQMAELYSDTSGWAAANRNNPDALEKAQAYLESSLYQIATETHKRAQDVTKDPKDYSLAADRYREYLQKFPFANDYYTIKWYMAGALYDAGRTEEALKEFEQLARASGHEHQEGATFMVFRSWYKILETRYGTTNTRPADALVERTEVTKGGTERPVYMLTDAHKAFIASVDSVKGANFQNPDYQQALDANRATLYYLAGQIYYEFGHYEEARKRLLEVVELFPRTDEGNYAARLVVNTYKDEGDLENLFAYSQRFARMNLGKTTMDPGVFTDLEEGAAFKLAFALTEQPGKSLEAAEAFMKFLNDYPKSANANVALYNAANNYEIAGRADRANELFEQYINTYPRDERSKNLYFRIATNYGAILELNKSIEYYERLYRFFPDYEFSDEALYNAGFLRTGQGDHKGAAQNFETYVSKYPQNPDTEIVYWLAGEQYKLIGDKEALAFYQRYLKKFPDQSPDHVLEAHYWMVQYYERTNDKKKAEATWAEIEKSYARFAAAGKLGPKARNIGAQAAFRKLQANYERFAKVEYPKSDDKLTEYLLTTKVAEYTAIQDQCLGIINTYQDFEYTSAALYIWGSTYKAYADMLFKAPAPPGVAGNVELEDIYRQELDKIARPIEDKAVARLESNVQKAKEEKRSSVWIDRSLLMLNDINPAAYPLEKRETRGTGDASVLPTSGPLNMPAAESTAPAPTTEEAQR